MPRASIDAAADRSRSARGAKRGRRLSDDAQSARRTLQLRFNAILLVVSLLIVALAIWIALSLADRLVRPVGELVEAARQVTGGRSFGAGAGLGQCATRSARSAMPSTG